MTIPVKAVSHIVRVSEVSEITGMQKLVTIFIHIALDKKLSVATAMVCILCYSYVTDTEYSSRIH